MRRHTTWMMTLLSLAVILVVYYLTMPTDAPIVQEKIVFDEQADVAVKETMAEEEVAVSPLDELRVKAEDERSVKREQLEEVVASAEKTSEEKNAAMEEMTTLAEWGAKEATLQSLIKGKGFGDVLVRADQEAVKVTIAAAKHDVKVANEVILLVKQEIGETKKVAVTFQPLAKK